VAVLHLEEQHHVVLQFDLRRCHDCQPGPDQTVDRNAGDRDSLMMPRRHDISADPRRCTYHVRPGLVVCLFSSRSMNQLPAADPECHRSMPSLDLQKGLLSGFLDPEIEPTELSAVLVQRTATYPSSSLLI
jgi:hypothetical protein